MRVEVLLDTSPIVACLRGKTELRSVIPEGALLFTSLLTYGELMKGVEKADFPENELAKVKGFLNEISNLNA